MAEPVLGATESFGELNFGAAELGDKRRTKRLVAVADALVRQPSGSLPKKLNGPGELDGLYHLMKAKKVTHQSILKSHIQRTFSLVDQRVGEKTLVLHDTTELDFDTHDSLTALGQIGNGSRRGYLCHNALAVGAQSRDVLGLANQVLHQRATVSKTETDSQRRKRSDRESLLWLKGTESLPANRDLVDVCDRGADTFEFLEHELQSGRTFVIRSNQNRTVFGTADATKHLTLSDRMKQLPSQGTRTVQVNAAKLNNRAAQKKGNKKTLKRLARKAQVEISYTTVWLRAPVNRHGNHGRQRLAIGVIRMWEPNPPVGQDALEWVLYTNHELNGIEDALEVIGWYESRWIVEEYHKAMKTGCNIEDPQFQSTERLEPMIALLSMVAITLLNLRDLARRDDAKTRKASDVVSAEMIEVVSLWRHRKLNPDMTIHEFCLALARMGGHLNRKRDGLPGWLTLWRGWSQMQMLLIGYRLQINKNKCA